MDIRPHRRLALVMNQDDPVDAIDEAARLYEHIGVLFIPAKLFEQYESIIQVGPEYGLDVLVDFRGTDITPHIDYLNEVKFGAQKLFVISDDPVSLIDVTVLHSDISPYKGGGFICNTNQTAKALREENPDTVIFSTVFLTDPEADREKTMDSGADYIVVDELINGKEKLKERIKAAREFADELRPYT